MSQLIDIRDRRPTLPGGALHIAGAVRRDGSDAPRTWPVLVARSFGLRPYPRQVSDDAMELHIRLK